MKGAQVINEIIKSDSFEHLLQSKQVQEHSVREVIRDHFPRIGLSEKLTLDVFLSDELLFEKLQRIFEMHQEISSRIESIEQQIHQRSRSHGGEDTPSAGKKITRAALARRHEKNQQEIRKDQIFVRLTPKSQTCIQFMLCNRNFPRMECKLSCNQHLEYLVNYLTNKWIRGKVGYKIVLYPDNSFLKGMPISEKEKALKEPLNNYLMFTDIMTCCGVHQNGVLNLCYEIVQVKKLVKQAFENNAEILSVQASQSNPAQGGQTAKGANPKEKNRQLGTNNGEPSSLSIQKQAKMDESVEPLPMIKGYTPNKQPPKEEYPRQASIFNRNPTYFNEQSIFGSLGFNFNFGSTPAKKDENIFSINSINYLDPHFQQPKKLSEQKKDKESAQRNQKDDEKIGLTDIKVEEVNEEASERSVPMQKSPQKEVGFSQQKQGKQSQEAKLSKEESIPQPDKKLDTLMSFLQQIQKEKPTVRSGVILPGTQQEQQNANSNKIKDVKFVSIVKKRTNMN